PSYCHLHSFPTRRSSDLVFTKVPIKLGNALFWLMLTIMFMPGIVVLIPLYVEIGHLGLASNFTPAILVYTAINIPYGTYLLRSRSEEHTSELQSPDHLVC